MKLEDDEFSGFSQFRKAAGALSIGVFSDGFVVPSSVVPIEDKELFFSAINGGIRINNIGSRKQIEMISTDSIGKVVQKDTLHLEAGTYTAGGRKRDYSIKPYPATVLTSSKNEWLSGSDGSAYLKIDRAPYADTVLYSLRNISAANHIAVHFLVDEKSPHESNDKEISEGYIVIKPLGKRVVHGAPPEWGVIVRPVSVYLDPP